tara:strand:+ start:160 stop:450 length:291 start_codon:yes stop_codon:yes gene_type:complete
MPKNLAVRKGEHLQQSRGNQIAVNLHAVRRKESPAVGNANQDAIKRNPAKKVNAKNRSPAQRKILRAKKEKNPVPIKKRTVLRKKGRSNFFLLRSF